MYDTTLFVFNELISEYTTELIDGNITMQIILLLGLYSFVMLFITIRLFLDNQHLDIKINSLRAEVNFLKKAERKLEEERSVWLNIIKNTNNSVKSVEKKVKKIEKEFTLYM
jgi:peptidoglycan hydrolase CwlO-like protein